jgi:hypothetical protein
MKDRGKIIVRTDMECTITMTLPQSIQVQWFFACRLQCALNIAHILFIGQTIDIFLLKSRFKNLLLSSLEKRWKSHSNQTQKRNYGSTRPLGLQMIIMKQNICLSEKII